MFTRVCHYHHPPRRWSSAWWLGEKQLNLGNGEEKQRARDLQWDVPPELPARKWYLDRLLLIFQNPEMTWHIRYGDSTKPRRFLFRLQFCYPEWLLCLCVCLTFFCWLITELWMGILEARLVAQQNAQPLWPMIMFVSQQSECLKVCTTFMIQFSVLQTSWFVKRPIPFELQFLGKGANKQIAMCIIIKLSKWPLRIVSIPSGRRRVNRRVPSSLWILLFKACIFLLEFTFLSSHKSG